MLSNSWCNSQKIRATPAALASSSVIGADSGAASNTAASGPGSPLRRDEKRSSIDEMEKRCVKRKRHGGCDASATEESCNIEHRCFALSAVQKPDYSQGHEG